MPQKYLASRINKLPKWARDYIHNVHTFVGAPELEELSYLRDQNRQLIKLVGELKAENRRLRKRLGLASASVASPTVTLCAALKRSSVHPRIEG